MQKNYLHDVTNSIGFKLFKLYIDDKLTTADLTAAHAFHQAHGKQYYKEDYYLWDEARSVPLILGGNPYSYLDIRRELADVYQSQIRLDTKIIHEKNELKIQAWLGQWNYDYDERFSSVEEIDEDIIRSRAIWAMTDDFLSTCISKIAWESDAHHYTAVNNQFFQLNGLEGNFPQFERTRLWLRENLDLFPDGSMLLSYPYYMHTEALIFTNALDYLNIQLDEKPTHLDMAKIEDLWQSVVAKNPNLLFEAAKSKSPAV